MSRSDGPVSELGSGAGAACALSRADEGRGVGVRGLVAGDGARERVCGSRGRSSSEQRRPSADKVSLEKGRKKRIREDRGVLDPDHHQRNRLRSRSIAEIRVKRAVREEARLLTCARRMSRFSPVRSNPARGVRRRLRTRARRRQVESPPQHSPGAGSPTPRVVRRSLRDRVRTPPARDSADFSRPPPSASRDTPRWKPSPSAQGARGPPREPSPASPWDPGRRYARAYDAHSNSAPRPPRGLHPRSARARAAPSATAFCAFTGAPFAIERQLTSPPRAGPLRVHVQAPQLRGRDQVHQGLHRAVQRGASSAATRRLAAAKGLPPRDRAIRALVARSSGRQSVFSERPHSEKAFQGTLSSLAARRSRGDLAD